MQEITEESSEEYDWPRLEVISLGKKILPLTSAPVVPPVSIFYMEQLAFVDQFLREYDRHTIVYGIGDDPRNLNRARYGPSLYLSFKLRHSIHHCAIPWVTLKLTGSPDKTSVDGNGFNKLQEMINFAQELDENWFSQLTSCPEFLDQPFESVDVQRELQFRSHLVLMRQRVKKDSEFSIIFYKHSELGRVKKIQERTITINFQKNCLKDSKSSRPPNSFQEVEREITQKSTALLSSRRQKKNWMSSKPVEEMLSLSTSAPINKVFATFVNLKDVLYQKNVQEIGCFFKTNADLQSLAHAIVQRLCSLALVSMNAIPGSILAQGVQQQEKTNIEDEIRVTGVEILEVICAFKGPSLCKFVWLALLNNMQSPANQASSIAVLHLLVLLKGAFSQFFFEWQPVGLLGSLYY